MLQMEIQPRQLIDPRFTQLVEAGRQGVYHVNLANFDIQLRPVPYVLPRGGILYVSFPLLLCDVALC